MRRPAALIVGGGPAGAMAAIRLAGHGISARVIERSAQPQDMLCGGFLSWSTVAGLRAIGVDPLALGGRPITSVRIVAGDVQATVALPKPAVALSRLRLDAALLERAAHLGADVVRGCRARAMVDGQIQLDDGEITGADAIILATGKHDLRGAGRPTPTDGMLGLRWRFRPSPRLDRMIAGIVELHLFEGGYAGLVRQEHSINLCLAITRDRFRAEGAHPEAILGALVETLPVLRSRLDGAERLGGTQAIANIPFGWRAIASSEGLFRIGDQGAVIPSLAGEGIAIALTSGAAAADAVVGRLGGDLYQAAFARKVRRPIMMADQASRLMNRPSLAPVMVNLIRRCPALLRYVAAWTRMPAVKISRN